MKKPWNAIPINECGEKLVHLQNIFTCFEPHPYLSLGAPYSDPSDPWKIRSGVFSRLSLAQEYLQLDEPKLCLGIFDAWRPIPVQAFMVDYSINYQCTKRGLDRNDPFQKLAVDTVIQEVGKYWAAPSNNPAIPPPHSTGAAIDLTLADLNGVPLDMGGEIDEIGSVSTPSFFREAAKNDQTSHKFHIRRLLLAHAMLKAGFVQHPNEWWHFSYGDQLWAWKSDSRKAIYGTCNPSESSFDTAASPRH